MIEEVEYWCGCVPDIEFKDENQWREHMISVHAWTNENFDSISKEMQNLEE